MRFDFEIEPLMQPVLFPFGARPETCYAEVNGETLSIQMGSLFSEKLPLSAVDSAAKDKWSLLGGLGVRIGFHNTMAVLASTKNVVKLSFKEPVMLQALGPFFHQTRGLYLALQDPDGFLAALKPAT